VFTPGAAPDAWPAIARGFQQGEFGSPTEMSVWAPKTATAADIQQLAQVMAPSSKKVSDLLGPPGENAVSQCKLVLSVFGAG
jgi:hypothetical protein